MRFRPACSSKPRRFAHSLRQGILGGLFLSAATCASAQYGVIPLDKPVATVNGEAITPEEFLVRLQNVRVQNFVLSANPLRLNENANAGQIALSLLINERLVLQYAAKTSLLPTDAEVDAEFQTTKKQPNVQQALEKKLFTDAQIKNELRVQKALFNIATINQSITPAEVKDYYDKHPEQWGQPERWKLSLIRVTSQAAADSVAAELKKGTPFATVAAKLSEDAATKANGGDIGTVSSLDRNIPDSIRAAVKTLKVGQYTSAITLATPAASAPEAKPTILFVLLAGKEDSTLKPLDQVRPQAERMALMDKIGGLQTAQKKIDEFRKTSTITVTLPAYQDFFKP